MEKITTKVVHQLIDEALKNGCSKQVEVPDSSMSYFRMLVSKYNKTSKIKISVRGVHGVYREVWAQKKSILDTGDHGQAFDLIGKVLSDPKYIITKEQLSIIEMKLQSINRVCQERCTASTATAVEAERETNNLLN